MKISNFIENEEYHIVRKQKYAEAQLPQEGNLRDRNMIFGKNTVFMKDYHDYLGREFNGNYPKIDLLLSQKIVNHDTNEPYYDLAYESRALVKLESLGVLILDSVSTLGLSSRLNVERFHLTVFGQKLLTYIKPQ